MPKSTDLIIESGAKRAAKITAEKIAAADPGTRTFTDESYTKVSLTPEEIELTKGGEEGLKQRLQTLGIKPISTR